MLRDQCGAADRADLQRDRRADAAAAAATTATAAASTPLHAVFLVLVVPTAATADGQSAVHIDAVGVCVCDGMIKKSIPSLPLSILCFS